MDALSCLAPPAGSQHGRPLLPGALTDDAIARALHFSSIASAAPPPPYCYAPQVCITTTTCDSVLQVADSPSTPGRRHHKQHLQPAGGRAGKKQRRSRASKRAPTTYITTDPANFRIMVQQITGELQPAAVLMAADTASVTHPLQLPVPAGGDPELHHQQQQQPCFPTLDSWNVVMYERSGDLL